MCNSEVAGERAVHIMRLQRAAKRTYVVITARCRRGLFQGSLDVSRGAESVSLKRHIVERRARLFEEEKKIFCTHGETAMVATLFCVVREKSQVIF